MLTEFKTPILTKHQAIATMENFFVDGGWSIQDYKNDLERIKSLSIQSKDFNQKDNEIFDVLDDIITASFIIANSNEV